MPGYVAIADYYFPPVAGNKLTKRTNILISLWLLADSPYKTVSKLETCVDTSHPKKDLIVHQDSHNHFAFQSSQLLHEARTKETHKQKCKRINHTQQSQRSFPFPSPTFYSQFNSLPTPFH
eukprot:g18900.t1